MDKLDENVEEFYCYVCSLQFYAKPVFDLHLKLMHEKQKGTQNLTMSQKLKKIKKEKNVVDIDECYQCDLCDVIFIQKCLLKEHLTTVHEENKSIDCHVYDLGLAEKGMVKKHNISLHEKEGQLNSENTLNQYLIINSLMIYFEC